MFLSLIAGFLIGIAFIVFALQNTAIVALTFLGWQFTSPLALVALLVFAAGVVLTVLICIPNAIRDHFLINRLQKGNEKLRTELEEKAAQLAALASAPPQTVSAHLE